MRVGGWVSGCAYTWKYTQETGEMTAKIWVVMGKEVAETLLYHMNFKRCKGIDHSINRPMI